MQDIAIVIILLAVVTALAEVTGLDDGLSFKRSLNHLKFNLPVGL